MTALGCVFVDLLGQTASGKALLYNVIDVNTGEVKCGKVYRKHDDTVSTIAAEINTSAATQSRQRSIAKYCSL